MLKIKKIFGKKSQALVEMAILGPLLLMAVGIVATYVAKLNNDQWELMRAFRYNLQKSHDDNKVVSFGTWDDRRMVSVSEPIIGQKITSSGSSTLHWAIPSVQNQGEDPENTTIVKINGGVVPGLYEYDLGSGKSGGIEPSYITFKKSEVTINEKNGNIASNRRASTTEIMHYKIDKNRYTQVRVHGASR